MVIPITYILDFFDKNTSDKYLNSLWNNLSWVDVAGPRLEYYCNRYNVPYTYGSGKGIRTYQPQPYHSVINEINSKLEDYTKSSFEVCFINGYRNQKDQLGWHADDSPEMDNTRPIAIITFGVEREIWCKIFLVDDLSTSPNSHYNL